MKGMPPAAENLFQKVPHFVVDSGFAANNRSPSSHTQWMFGSLPLPQAAVASILQNFL